jgi:putative membrane protein
MVLSLGAATAVAQSGAGATNPRDDSSSRRDQSGTTSGSTRSYDTGSTTDRSSTTSGTAASETTRTSDRAYDSSTTAASTTGRDKLSWGDRRFVNKAAEEGHAEHQLAQLAAQRATSSEVRTYAQKLVEEHAKVNAELKTIASEKNVDVDIDDDQDRAYKRLNKKTGSEFDQEFVEHMIDEHERDIKMFEKAASDAKDPEVRAFASKHVGSLREHLQQAQSLRQTLMPTGRLDDSSGRSTPGATPGSGLGTSSTDSTSTRTPQ